MFLWTWPNRRERSGAERWCVMRTIEHDMLLPLAAMAGIPSNVLDQRGIRIARCDYDGEMCPEGDANAAYIIKCVNSYADLQADNAKLRACVELYADSDNWLYSDSQCHLDLWGKTDHGYEPAKKCLEELRG